MSTIRSDNNLYTNPKPSQEYERKLVDGEYVDWDSTDEIDAFFAIPPLDPSYKNNKYFWVEGSYYQYTGSEYRIVGGDGTLTDADNGLHIVDQVVKLGGQLTENTELYGLESGLIRFILRSVDSTTVFQFLKGALNFQINNGIFEFDPDTENWIFKNATTELLIILPDGSIIIPSLANEENANVTADASGKLQVGGAGNQGQLLFVVGDDPGPPYEGFDGYIAAGTTAVITQLIGRTLASMVWGGVTMQCWLPGSEQFLFDSDTGEVDNTLLGPWSNGDWVIFNYK